MTGEVTLTAIGAIGLAIGVVAAFGFIPGLQLVTTPCGDLSSSFTYVAGPGNEVVVNLNPTIPSSPEYLWAYVHWGDGSSSNEYVAPNFPILGDQHVYSSAGTYSIDYEIQVQCSGGNGGTTALQQSDQTQSVTVPPAEPGYVVAAFSVSWSGQTATATDHSKTYGGDGIASISWTWGDKATATGTPVTHKYTPGTYTLTEFVKDTQLGTTVSTSQVAYVNGTGGGSPPTVKVSFSVSWPEKTTAAFADTSTTTNDSISSIAWNYGDGNTGTGSSVSHTYLASGTFKVTDTVKDSHGSYWYGYQNITITNTGGGSGGKNTIAALYDYSLIANRTLYINDTSTIVGNPDVSGISVAWGDGSSSTPQYLSFSTYHVYSKNGSYYVKENINYLNGTVAENTSYTVLVNATFGNIINSHPTSAHQFTLNAATGALIFGFGALMALGWAVMRFPQYVIPAIAVLFVAGTVVGYIFGGL